MRPILNKLFFVFSVASFTFLLFPKPLYSKSGCCSSHGGVDCSAGPQSNGHVICNDGWRSSSCLYSEMVKCGGSSGGSVILSHPSPTKTTIPTAVPTTRPTSTPRPLPTNTPTPTSTPTNTPTEILAPTLQPTTAPSPAVLGDSNQNEDLSGVDIVSGVTTLGIFGGGAYLLINKLAKQKGKSSK